MRCLLVTMASPQRTFGKLSKNGRPRSWRSRDRLEGHVPFDVTGCDDKTSLICGASLCRSDLPGLGAECQGFSRHDGNRAHELRSLAVYARASIRGNRLDLRFLDGTQLRCCSK